MGAKMFFATLVGLVVVGGVLEAAVVPSNNVFGKPGFEQKCVCVNGKWCDGEIINEVQCHPSYIMVCCIQPKPEPNPPYPLYPPNIFETETKKPEKKPQLLVPLEQKPLSVEKQPEVNKKTPDKEQIGKGVDSIEPSLESSEEIKEKETIKVILI